MNRKKQQPPPLSKRMRQVIEHAGRGHTVKETAAALGISQKTVEAYRSEIITRLGVPNITAAVLQQERLKAAA